MSHEPECPGPNMVEWLSDLLDEPVQPCETCSIVRAAYRRGREDAAHAVDAACRMWQCSREELAHYTEAARGDGEKA